MLSWVDLFTCSPVDLLTPLPLTPPPPSLLWPSVSCWTQASATNVRSEFCHQPECHLPHSLWLLQVLFPFGSSFCPPAKKPTASISKMSSAQMDEATRNLCYKLRHPGAGQKPMKFLDMIRIYKIKKKMALLPRQKRSLQLFLIQRIQKEEREEDGIFENNPS